MIEEFDDMNPKEIEDLLGFVDTIDDGDVHVVDMTVSDDLSPKFQQHIPDDLPALPGGRTQIQHRATRWAAQCLNQQRSRRQPGLAASPA